MTQVNMGDRLKALPEAQMLLPCQARTDLAPRMTPRQRLTRELRDAISRHQLTQDYQPLFEIAGGNSCGVEALARWRRSNGESIDPALFIQHAEQTGLISALGSWALQEACSTVAKWCGPGEDIPTLGVNISTHQIGPEFFAILARTLERTEFPPQRLELEITESILIADPEFALTCLDQWKQLGVRIAVDDFGTGFSNRRCGCENIGGNRSLFIPSASRVSFAAHWSQFSGEMSASRAHISRSVPRRGLSYLSRLPVDRLKVDGSLIRGITSDRRTAAIVRAVIALGKELGIAVLAEGVETEEQLSMLTAFGCLQVQGYLLTPPVCASEARSLLGKRWGARRSGSADAR